MAEHWEGVPGATEHRTVGARAWCFQDAMWCYPKHGALCLCCMAASDEYEVCPTCNGEGYVKK